MVLRAGLAVTSDAANHPRIAGDFVKRSIRVMGVPEKPLLTDKRRRIAATIGEDALDFDNPRCWFLCHGSEKARIGNGVKTPRRIILGGGVAEAC